MSKNWGPNVTVEAVALYDDRLGVLAEVCGLADGDHARGKLERLWSHATKTAHYTVNQAVVRSVLGPRGVDGLVIAQLGELVDGHMPTAFAAELLPQMPGEPVVRLRGTRGRIEWFGAQRAAASAGGRKRAATAKRDKNGSFSQVADTSGKAPDVDPSRQPAGDQPDDTKSNGADSGPSRQPAADQRSTSGAPASRPAEHQPNTSLLSDPRSQKEIPERAREAFCGQLVDKRMDPVRATDRATVADLAAAREALRRQSSEGS